jgi:hypothetical protein
VNEDDDDDDWGRDSIVLLFTREPVRTIVFIGFFDCFTREVDPWRDMKLQHSLLMKMNSS